MLKKLIVGQKFQLPQCISTFEITKVDSIKNSFWYKVIEGGRIGQVNKYILDDFIYLNKHSIKFIN